MEELFTWCAVIGGSIFAVQFLMLLLGLHGGHDLDMDHPDLDVPHLDVPGVASDVDAVHDLSPVSVTNTEFDHHTEGIDYSDGWFVGILTLRSLVAATTVFGLTGLAARQHMSPERAVAAASLAGLGMLYLVGWSFKQLYLLQADGTVRMQDAVGCSGTVYLSIPGQNQGAGKVTVKVAGRTMEYRAMTAGEALKTGTPIVVNSVLSETTLEVESQIPDESTSSGMQQNS